MRLPRRQPARSLDGQVVAITGGARGIGRCTAQLLAGHGARVIIGDRDEDVLAATGAELGVATAPLDVSSIDSWTGFLQAAAELGPLDVLVNNAGIMPLGDALKEPAEVTRRIFEVNALGPINGTKAVAPGMVERGHGQIVNVSSAVGRVAAAGGATYSASKHAIVGYTEAVRQELAPHGVEVNMVLPSIVRTELAAGVPDTKGLAPVTPEQVAEVIVDVIRRPVAEAWVPRWTQPMVKVTSALPRRAQEGMARAFGADHVLADVDDAARAAYEQRARG